MSEPGSEGRALGEPGDAGAMPEDDVVALGAEIAAAHAAGRAYGALHPGNVVLDAAGTARLADSAHETAATWAIAYRAPEAVGGGGPTVAGDLYALGVVLYELSAGSLPPRHEPPLRPAGLSEPRWAVLRALLAADPAARPSARDVADLLAGRPSVPPPAPAPADPVTSGQTAPIAATFPDARGLRRGGRRLVGALAVLSVGGVAALGWALLDGDGRPAQTPAAAVSSAAPVAPAAPGNGPIAYVSLQDGVWRLFRVNADGTGRAPLSDLGADTNPPVFSPDGTRIAFGAYRTGEQGLYVMNVDGTGLLRLHESGRWPSFSPDGRRIAFDAMWNRRDEVHTINVDGTGLTRLTDDGRADTPRTPVFSPDGTKILCTGYAGDDQAVFLLNADGTGRRELTPHGALPSFSPDGTKVAFTGTTDNEVYVIDADGTDPTRLTHNLARDWFPRFSPDGTRIVFTSNRGDAGPDSEDFGAYVMNADGTGQTRLLEQNLGRSVPTFSPDGTKIALSALRGDPAAGDFEMYVLNADGTDPTELSVHGANPVWGPMPRG